MQLRELDPIINESQGFKFGIPIRADEKSMAVVLPIIRTQYDPRNYLTYPETDRVQVKDTGSIGFMEATNTHADTNVFIRSGTIFTGNTQTRALHRSAVLLPGKAVRLDVHCIYQSKPISGGAGVKYGGLTSHDFDSKVYNHGFVPKSQSDYWAAAHEESSKYMRLSGKSPEPRRAGGLRFRSAPRPHGYQSMSSLRDSLMDRMASDEANITANAMAEEKTSDDLAGNIDSFAETFDSVLSKVKCVENQAGLALINQLGVETIELFDHPGSWSALHSAAVKRLGSNIVQKDDESVFQYKPEVARKLVTKVLALDWEKNKILEHDGKGGTSFKIWGLSSDGYVGEIVEINGQMVHLVILKKAA